MNEMYDAACCLVHYPRGGRAAAVTTLYVAAVARDYGAVLPRASPRGRFCWLRYLYHAVLATVWWLFWWVYGRRRHPAAYEQTISEIIERRLGRKVGRREERRR